MRVQGQQHGCAFLDDAYARMTTPVDTTLVSFGQTKPTLQIQVVSRYVRSAATHEQPRFEARHHTPHLLADRIFGCQQFALQRTVTSFALGPAVGSGIKRPIDPLNLLDVGRYLFLRFHHQAFSFVDAIDQAFEQRLRAPPFLSRTLRRNDRCTSPSASDIRRPGGRNGPPWLSLMMPRTAAQ